jgi:hypothetical protein
MVSMLNNKKIRENFLYLGSKYMYRTCKTKAMIEQKFSKHIQKEACG